MLYSVNTVPNTCSFFSSFVILQQLTLVLYRFCGFVHANPYPAIPPNSTRYLHRACFHHLHCGRCGRSPALQFNPQQFPCRGMSTRPLHITVLISSICKLGYWIAFWVVILLEEHYIFRRKDGVLGGYDMSAYDSPAL